MVQICTHLSLVDTSNSGQKRLCTNVSTIKRSDCTVWLGIRRKINFSKKINLIFELSVKEYPKMTNISYFFIKFEFLTSSMPNVHFRI